VGGCLGKALSQRYRSEIIVQMQPVAMKSEFMLNFGVFIIFHWPRSHPKKVDMLELTPQFENTSGKVGPVAVNRCKLLSKTFVREAVQRIQLSGEGDPVPHNTESNPKKGARKRVDLQLVIFEHGIHCSARVGTAS
jgi:hypothetical protein